jgi:hypothetical protein
VIWLSARNVDSPAGGALFSGHPDTGPIFRALVRAFIQEITAPPPGAVHSPEGRKTYTIEFKPVISIF